MKQIITKDDKAVSHKFKLNREGNSSHGFGKDMEWDVTVQEENKVQFPVWS